MKNKNLKWDNYFMDVAIRTSEQSYCERAKVGAVIIRDRQIIATGYNGTPSGLENCCESNFIICPKCGSRINVDNKVNIIYKDAKIITIFCNKCNIKIPYSKDHIQKLTNDYVIHAEQNALMQCAKFGQSTDGASIYITHSPCKVCTNLLVQSGIKEVIYKEKYHSDGIELLEKLNIKVRHI